MTKVQPKQVGGSHYEVFKIQPITFINENNLPFCEGSVVKYVCRHPYKNGKEDLLKAIQNIQFIIDRDYPDDRQGAA